jgi:hypothetical protein
MTFDDLNISLFYKPYPYQTSEQTIQYGTIEAKGFEARNPDKIIYFKVVFLKDLVIDY